MAKIARVGIVGGGVAGLAAAVALAGRDIEIELFEANSQLGGRACHVMANLDTSLEAAPRESCQQVSAGCDVNLARFLVQIGAARDWELHSRLHYYSPEGKRSDLAAVPGLPAPLHLLPSLFRLGFLSFRERWNVAKALLELAKPIAEEDEGLSILRWLRLHDQTPLAIERFWAPLLVERLGTGLESASLASARKEILDRYLLHRAGYSLRIPSKGMAQCMALPAEKWLLRKEATLHLATPVRLILGSADRCQGLLLESGETQSYDLVIAAVSWWSLGSLLSENLRKSMPYLAKLEACVAEAGSFVDLWFDRPLTPLSHAMPVDSVVQQVLRCHARAAADRQTASGFHYQAIVNAERMPRDLSEEAIVDQVQRALMKIWPACRDASLIQSRVTSVPQAKFPSSRAFEALRPSQTTAVPNLILAGDWTRTGKPSSLESAVRSGYLAAEAVLEYLGCPAKILAPEPAPEWVARRLFKMN